MPGRTATVIGTALTLGVGMALLGPVGATASIRPAKHHHGSRILYERTVGVDSLSVRTVRSNGAGLRVLARNAYHPVWSPNGRTIAYQANTASAMANGVWVMRADGSHKHRVSGTSGWAPSWSPDSRRLAYAAAGGSGRVWLARSDGTHRRRLPGRAFGYPAWSPRGGKIAYVHNCSIWVIGVDGSRRHRLARKACSVAWAPNGRRLAYDRGWTDRASIWVVRVGGAHRHRVPGTAGGINPVWSPNGKKLAYSDTRNSTIVVINADGSHRHVVATDAYSPVWAPGGRRLAFAVAAGIATAKVDGRDRRQLTRDGDGTYLDSASGWRPAR